MFYRKHLKNAPNVYQWRTLKMLNLLFISVFRVCVTSPLMTSEKIKRVTKLKFATLLLFWYKSTFYLHLYLTRFVIGFFIVGLV